MLAVTVSPTRLAESLNANPLPAGWRSYVVDNTGRFMVPPPRSQIGDRIGPSGSSARSVSMEGVYEGLTSYGENTIVAFKKSGLTGWTAHVLIPLAIYNQPLRQMLNWIAIATAIALALTVLFALLNLSGREACR